MSWMSPPAAANVSGLNATVQATVGYLILGYPFSFLVALLEGAVLEEAGIGCLCHMTAGKAVG